MRLYSRDLHDVSDGYPGGHRDRCERSRGTASSTARCSPSATAWRCRSSSSRQRLGRKNPSAEMQAQVPVIYVAFDLLALGAGRTARAWSRCCVCRCASDAPGLTRWACQTCRAWPRPTCSPRRPASELSTIFDAAQERGNEGLMVKDPDSTYTPGRRGYGWLKLKRPLATLDCVVVGVEVGHGKRHGVLSDYTFAVRDDRPGSGDRLVTIGKAYSGLTDKEIAEMTAWFQEHTLAAAGRFHVVEPTVVVEIAFDVIHRSNRHDSGFALRFPRIFRLRPDKDAREIDTLSNVEMLFKPARKRAPIQRPDQGRRRAAGMSTDRSRTAEQKVARLRELLPATSAGIYLDTAYRGPLPAETAAAMREADDWELRVGRATEGRDEDLAQRVEEARAVLAALLVADPSEIVLTAGVRRGSGARGPPLE